MEPGTAGTSVPDDAGDSPEITPRPGDLFTSPGGERLSRSAPTYWAIVALAVAVPLLGIALLLRGPIRDATWIPDIVAELLWIGLLADAILEAFVFPRLRWRRWRYHVRPTDIEVFHGNLIRRRAIVPMNRVQHVEVTSGLLMRSFDMAKVEIFTTAGSIEIPAVDEAIAEALRTHIAELARLADDG